MDRAEKTQMIAAWIACAPYVAIAWGFTRIDESVSFWMALGVLVGVRLLFSVVETLGGVLAWRLYGRRKTIDAFVKLLRDNKFPQRQYRSDDESDYLARIEDDLDELDVQESPAVILTRRAGEIRQMLGIYETVSVLGGWRMRAAFKAALESYSPAAHAPVMAFAEEEE